jgi:hypothetical protein
MANMNGLLVGLLAAGGIALGAAPAASADEGSYLDALQNAGVLVLGGDECHEYPGNDGCSMRFADGSGAMFTGQYVCEELGVGAPVSDVIYGLSRGDGVRFTPENASRVVVAASTHLC